MVTTSVFSLSYSLYLRTICYISAQPRSSCLPTAALVLQRKCAALPLMLLQCEHYRVSHSFLSFFQNKYLFVDVALTTFCFFICKTSDGSQPEHSWLTSCGMNLLVRSVAYTTTPRTYCSAVNLGCNWIVFPVDVFCAPTVKFFCHPDLDTTESWHEWRDNSSCECSLLLCLQLLLCSVSILLPGAVSASKMGSRMK